MFPSFYGNGWVSPLSARRANRASGCCIPLALDSLFATSGSAALGTFRYFVLIKVFSALPTLVFPLRLKKLYLALRSPQTIMLPPFERRRLKAASISLQLCVGVLEDAYRPTDLWDEPLLSASFFTIDRFLSSEGLCALRKKCNPLCGLPLFFFVLAWRLYFLQS